MQRSSKRFFCHMFLYLQNLFANDLLILTIGKFAIWIFKHRCNEIEPPLFFVKHFLRLFILCIHTLFVENYSPQATCGAARRDIEQQQLYNDRQWTKLRSSKLYASSFVSENLRARKLVGRNILLGEERRLKSFPTSIQFIDLGCWG